MTDGFVKMETENYKFFQHKACEFFPCHETKDIDNFNCLFCYCPLYALGENCGGNFKILENGVKDCSNCLLPHKRSNYDYIGQKCADAALPFSTDFLLRISRNRTRPPA